MAGTKPPLRYFSPSLSGDFAQAVEELTEGGISPLAGLVGVVAEGDSATRNAVALVWPRVVMQHCAWHILEPVASAVGAEKGDGASAVHQVVREAGPILVHDEPGLGALREARERHDVFLVRYKGSAWAEIVGRGFPEGTEDLGTGNWDGRMGAERTVRGLRRRAKAMDGFKSVDGGQKFAFIWRMWQNLGRERAQERAGQVRHRTPAANLKVC